MKRITSSLLCAALIMVPCSAPAPVPICLAIAFKVIGATGLGATCVIIYKCQPSYYLIETQTDGESRTWLASQASEVTCIKNEWLRCEGPFPDKKEPDFRAWCNNQNPAAPMFPCGPLGTIPGPVRTNWPSLTLQQSTNAGASFCSVATLTNASHADNWSFALVPAGGTNGMTREQILEVMSASMVITNYAGSFSQFRVLVSEP